VSAPQGADTMFRLVYGKETVVPSRFGRAILPLTDDRMLLLKFGSMCLHAAHQWCYGYVCDLWVAAFVCCPPAVLWVSNLIVF